MTRKKETRRDSTGKKEKKNVEARKRAEMLWRNGGIAVDDARWEGMRRWGAIYSGGPSLEEGKFVRLWEAP